MGNPALQLAEQIHSASPQDGSPQEVLARALLEANADVIATANRYTELYRKFNTVCHELERLRERVEESRTAISHQASQQPRLSVFCNAPGCTTPPLSMQPAPPDEAVAQWVRGRGWQWLGEGEQYCPAHTAGGK